MTLPSLVSFSDHEGDWAAYEDALNAIFMQDLAHGKLQFRGWNVGCKRHDEYNGRWFTFWHLIQEGEVEEDRTPDLRRCERLPWVRWVVENAEAHSEIDIWENWRGTNQHLLMWFREEYLVVLAKRNGYWLLKTAYCTDKRGRIQQLRKERDRFLKQTGP